MLLTISLTIGLDIFKFDPNYVENEEKYKEIKAEILGEDSDEESGSEESDESDEEEGTLWSQLPNLIICSFLSSC
jgi:pre-mRNA-splicing factor CWC22